MKKTTRCMKNLDMFGHPVSLTFKSQGSKYNTIIGGMCSIMLVVFLIWFCAFKIVILANRNDPSIQLASK